MADLISTRSSSTRSRRLTVPVKSMSLLKLVEERALSKKPIEEEKQHQLVPYIPKECILNILVRLPLESLQKLMLVCKTWYMIIKSSTFIDTYFQRSENVLIFLTPLTKKGDPFFPYGSSILQENTNAFSVESKLFDLQSVPMLKRPVINPSLLFSLKFLKYENGNCKIKEYDATCMGKIRASCCGLILLDNLMKKGGLIVMNPVTRTMSALPVGTIFPSSSESYGLAFSKKTNEFKLVHLFLDSIQYIGCEILTPNAKTWRSVDGPQFIGRFRCNNPVFAAGALHWALQIVDHCDYIVSMEVDSEKFKRIMLPKSYGDYDKIMEINGNLGYLTEEGSNRIDVWILCGQGQGWKKQYTITEEWWKDMVPLYCPRFKDEIIIVMDKSGALYAYNFRLQTMKKMEKKVQQEKVPRDSCFVHVNSLFTWKRRQVNDDNLAT